MDPIQYNNLVSFCKARNEDFKSGNWNVEWPTDITTREQRRVFRRKAKNFIFKDNQLFYVKIRAPRKKRRIKNETSIIDNSHNQILSDTNSNSIESPPSAVIISSLSQNHSIDNIDLLPQQSLIPQQNILPHSTLSNNLIENNNEVNQPSENITKVELKVIKEDQLNDLWYRLHDCDNHARRDRIIDKINKECYFLGVRKWVEKQLKNCEACSSKSPMKSDSNRNTGMLNNIQLNLPLQTHYESGSISLSNKFSIPNIHINHDDNMMDSKQINDIPIHTVTDDHISDYYFPQ